MDALSSSFLSTFSTQKLLYRTTTPPPPPSSSPILNVRIEEKPQQAPTKKTTQPISTSTTPPPKTSSQTQSSIRSSSSSNSLQSTKRKAEPSVPALVFNALDDIINTFIDPPVKPSVDPKHVLSQNFAPVLNELPPTECKVIQGSLPPSLNGAYIRNGPNPQFLPRGPYHLFDAARGALSAARILTGQVDLSNGFGLANTSLVLFANRLLALGESDLPYSVRLSSNGDIETLGRYDFDGKLFMSMTAHPKIDSDTGEAFAFRYGPVPPFLTYFRFDKNGVKQPDVPIFSMTRPSFLHDFAITKKYAIFADIQIGMNPLEMIAGGSPVGSDPSKVSRIGVIPRYAKDESEMKWFDVPGFNIIHAINAWDEEDVNAIEMVAPNILSVEHTLERMELVHALVEKVRIDLNTGIVKRYPISARNLDFAVINQAYVGKKNKYVYAAVGDPMPKISGVVKLDLSKGDHREDCIVASRMYGEGCYGGEPFFVAREAVDNLDAKEDDGYVVSYVHDENTGESRFLVMDAKSPNLDLVATVKLPRRVPYGFHGLFVAESDLNRI
nr:putative carotenoid cleavage dioxygenase 4, chloroplastic [Quercus suber]